MTGAGIKGGDHCHYQGCKNGIVKKKKIGGILQLVISSGYQTGASRCGLCLRSHGSPPTCPSSHPGPSDALLRSPGLSLLLEKTWDREAPFRASAVPWIGIHFWK